MKKSFLTLAVLIFGQTLFAQTNLDTIWQNSVVDNYKKYENYTMEVFTNSTIRGKYTTGRGYIDTIYNKMDTALLYIEPQKMVGVQCESSISYTENDTNTMIDFVRKFIAIYSLQEQWGRYFNDVSIHGATHFYTSIIGRRPYFKKIDKISDIGDYFVFECIDSSTSENDIQMYENVKMYVNKNTYLLERITTKRQNNTLAELGLGAIEREIVINYLEFNQPNSIYKEWFRSSQNHYPDFRIAKSGNPYIANQKAFKKREEKEEKFENSKSILNQKLLNCEIAGFEGNIVKLNDIKGWVLLDFWYKSCFPCFEMMKEVALNKQEFEQRGVTIISLNSCEQPSDYLQAFCEKMKVSLADLYFFKNKEDIAIFEKQIKIFPSIFLISPDKKVVWQTAGKKSAAELLQEIDKFIKK